MREKILTYIEHNSRIDLEDLAMMLGTDEATIMTAIPPIALGVEIAAIVDILSLPKKRTA